MACKLIGRVTSNWIKHTGVKNLLKPKPCQQNSRFHASNPKYSKLFLIWEWAVLSLVANAALPFAIFFKHKQRENEDQFK